MLLQVPLRHSFLCLSGASWGTPNAFPAGPQRLVSEVETQSFTDLLLRIAIVLN